MAICVFLPVSHIMRTFHLFMSTTVLAVRRGIGLMIPEESSTSLWCVTTPTVKFMSFKWLLRSAFFVKVVFDGIVFLTSNLTLVLHLGSGTAINLVAHRTEKTTRGGNVKPLHTSTKNLSRKIGKPEPPEKNKEGKPIPENQEQRDLSVECFDELLNRLATPSRPQIEVEHADTLVAFTPPTIQEIRMVVHHTNQE